MSNTTTQKRGPITCHVLDSARGIPGKNIEVLLECQQNSVDKEWITISKTKTNEDGRCSDLVSPDYRIQLIKSEEDCKAIYRITFFTTPYFKSFGEESFYPFVQVVFQIKDPTQHYHVPLLIAPFSYTTYRGS
ncbi:22685_t:CDS:2 [Cetraspora pellucida]|uniref:5-hydroxyisourate hydrolase n=1 Tax=Cetraspora pellucida TaxID=1433469 RepID=A0A9N9NP60_9GLOM|nr:22685_t:CDS:2 [Cetraspora pellucida]